MNDILASNERHDDMSLMRPPALIMLQAREAAMVLKDTVSKKPKPVLMNGEQYLEFEDWQTVGKFYGITAKVESTTYIDYGGVRGFEARASAITSDGRVISAADAMCLNDEPKWSTRAKYEYVNGQKKKVGEEPVPLFQLRSMAQTRACAKALRNVLSWVVVLAGYKTTPAEEISSDHGHGSKQSQPKPQGQGQARGSNGKTITEGQKKLIFAKSKSKNVSEDDIKKAFGVADIAHLKMDQMNAVINFIENGVLPGGAPEPSTPEGCPKDVATCGSAELNGDMKTVCAVNNGALCPFANV